MSQRRPPYRDGKVHVMAQECSTCIFRPGNLMHLHPGRLKDMVTSAREADSTIVCHKSLPDMSDIGEAACRGFADRYDTLPLRLGRALDMIVEVDEPQ